MYIVSGDNWDNGRKVIFKEVVDMVNNFKYVVKDVI